MLPAAAFNIGAGLLTLFIFAPMVGDITIAEPAGISQVMEIARPLLIVIWVLGFIFAALLRARGGGNRQGLTGLPLAICAVGYGGVVAAYGDGSMPTLVQGALLLAVSVSAATCWGGTVISDGLRYFGAAACLFVMAESGLPGGILAPVSLLAVTTCALAPLIGGIGGQGRRVNANTEN